MAEWNSMEHALNDERSTKRMRMTPLPNRLPTESSTELLEEPSNEKLVIAETAFFNQQNCEFWSSKTLEHLRPFDFPFIRAQCQQPIRESLSPEDVRHRNTVRVNIPPVPRKYEEEYLREPLRNERSCVMGDQCQGLKLAHIENPFILREFLLPSEEEEYKRSGKLPSETRLCLMCKRSQIARAFFNIRADGMGVKENVILQDYRNLVGQPGEYCMDDCIVSSDTIFQGLLDPIVKHIKSAYRLKDQNGIRYYEQWRYKVPDTQESFLVNMSEK